MTKKMPIKKENRISIRLTPKAMFCLQNAGYINGKKKSTGKGYSPFISKLIIDYFELGKIPDRARVRYKTYVDELSTYQKIRDKAQDKIMELAEEIRKIRSEMK